jgi:hypothetical protein
VEYAMWIKEKSGSKWNGWRSGIVLNQTQVFWNDGVNVVVLNCTAEGSLTIYRESGTSTFEVAMRLFWV